MERIYLDYNASTPIVPQVAEAMRPYLSDGFGNPSSLHWAGTPARLAVARAREQVASALSCSPDEIVFTSGGSEANNFAIKGVFYSLMRGAGGAARAPGAIHFVTSAVEHPATREPLRFLQALGAGVTVVSVDRHGRVDPADVERAITPETCLVTVMHANNEVGTIQPIAEIGEITHRRGILFHTDAAQSMGKIPVRPVELGVDLLSLAAHKFYGPKGVGALYVRRGVDLEPLIHGAGHESGRRAGTENVLLLVGLGGACEHASSQPGMAAVAVLRDWFESELMRRFGDRVVINGHPQHRLPNTLSVNFAGRVGSDILSGLETVAASTGSACHAGSVELSPVLQAMGVAPEVGIGAVRFSLGRPTTRAEIEEVLARLDRLPR